MENIGNRLAVLIPALNEAEVVASVIDGVRRHRPDATVVVIDDASTDDTAAVAESCGAVVLPLPIRLGAWGATRTGFRYARQQGFDIVVTMDADGQHRPELIGDIVSPVTEGKTHVVIGSCIRRGSVGRRITWRFFRWLTGLDVADLTSGFRAYCPAAVEVIMSGDTALLDYQDIGVLFALRRAGLRIVEVPVEMCCRRNGISRVYSSWMRVMRYLAVTMVVSLANKGFKPLLSGLIPFARVGSKP
ncbi:glycosyltransferase family 2 protein [Desulfatirhabdium butyrativorans]|uniref:glycosyltransferase family 2 protein n=1 Tax=Desulfatirhabdium butyrativorans TaxID=340467 RepID=UPI0003F570F4|nr:glycosyltransferase family 2 protein [Desulfatirhabdium butyrativorans]